MVRTRTKLITLICMLLFVGSAGAVAVSAAPANTSDTPTFYVTDGNGTVLQQTYPTAGDASVRPTHQDLGLANGAVKSSGGVAAANANTSVSRAGISKTAPPLSWWQNYGGSGSDNAYSMQQTSDGGYILAGTTNSYGAGGFDAWLVKTDASGNEQWNRTFGGSGDEVAYAVQQTRDGGYILCGSKWTSGNSQLYLVKVDAAGRLSGLTSSRKGAQTWVKTYGGPGSEEGYSVQQTSDGGYIVVGYTTSNHLMLWQVYALKTDAYGNVQWQRTYGGNGNDFGACVREVPGGYIICGGTSSFSGAGYDRAYLIKTDKDGLVMNPGTWETVIGPTDVSSRAHQLVQTSDGGYVFTGFTYRASSGLDLLICKVDANGNEQWNRTYGGSLDDEGLSIAKTSDGGYVVAGYRTFSDSTGSDTDCYLVKTDSYGNWLWEATPGLWGTNNNDYAWSVVQAKDGGYVMAGWNTWQSGGQATLYKYGP